MNSSQLSAHSNYAELLEHLMPHGQQHLLQFWNELDAVQQQQLAAQIASIDFPLVSRLLKEVAKHDDWAALARRAKPPTAFRLDGSGNEFSIEEARAAGTQALQEGKVGAILVAGGQGTRLGFDHPKGMFPIGPISHASLFQILFEKLLAVSRRYCAAVPLYLMTSPATDAETKGYLEAHNRFGIPADNIQIFCQGVMPAVDLATGRVLLAGKAAVALSPDGHGGMLSALRQSGGLADAERRGLKHLFYFQVDNPLVEVCDPIFIGYHILSGSQMSTLAIAKTEPTERVGNVVQVDGRTRIIEYIDMPNEVAQQRNADGSLRLWAGSTAIHVLDMSFLQRVSQDPAKLPYHIARKRIPCLNVAGEFINPTEPNAAKFERFIFDLLPLAKKAVVVEGDAARMFAPVKNGHGEPRDSPETCAAAMVALHRQWVRASRIRVADNVAVEISPLFALDATEVRAKLRPATVISAPTYFAEE